MDMDMDMGMDRLGKQGSKEASSCLLLHPSTSILTFKVPSTKCPALRLAEVDHY